MSHMDINTFTVQKKQTIFKHILMWTFLFLVATIFCFFYLEYRRPIVYTIKYLNTFLPKETNQIDVAILITSQSDNQKRREMIRNTWLKEEDKKLNFKVMHYFVVGYLDISKRQWDFLQKENEEYGDILTLPTYDNASKLVWKVSDMFYWFHEVGLLEYNFQYLLKCDDTTYVRLDKLTEALKEIEEVYTKPYMDKTRNKSLIYETINVQDNNLGNELEEKALYWGYFAGNLKANQNWLICENHNPFARGGGYVLSSSLVSFFANNKNYLRYYHSEDVSVGAWLAPIDNVVRIHDRRFDTEYVSRGCQNYYLIRHNISPDEMKILYSNLKDNQLLCTQETRTRKEYIYDWSVPPSKCCERVIE